MYYCAKTHLKYKTLVMKLINIRRTSKKASKRTTTKLLLLHILSLDRYRRAFRNFCFCIDFICCLLSSFSVSSTLLGYIHCKLNTECCLGMEKNLYFPVDALHFKGMFLFHFQCLYKISVKMDFITFLWNSGCDMRVYECFMR